MTVINYFQEGFGRNLLPRFSLHLVQDEMTQACQMDSNFGLLFNQMQIITFSVLRKWPRCDSHTRHVNNDVSVLMKKESHCVEEMFGV